MIEANIDLDNLSHSPTVMDGARKKQKQRKGISTRTIPHRHKVPPWTTKTARRIDGRVLIPVSELGNMTGSHG